MKRRFSWPLLLVFCALAILSAVPFRAADVKPAVKDLYVFSATHFDLNFTGPPPFSYARNHRILDSALDLAREQPNFRYAIENLYLLDQYLRIHPEQEEPLTAALRNRKIELAAQWSDILQNLSTGEDLVRNLLVAHQFAKLRFNVTPEMQTLSDIPGQTPQAPQILARAGLNGLIITRAGPSDSHLFNWKGLDGSAIRVASLPFGYAGGYFLGLAESLEAMEGTKLAEFELSDISPDIMTNKIKQFAGLEPSVQSLYPASLDRALVEVAWDNAMPPAEVSRNMEAWNSKYPDRIRLNAVLPGDFFRMHWPSAVPVKTGEIPSVWGNGTGAIFGGYQQHIRTSHRLLRAEKWASLAEVMTGKKYPADDLHNAWKEHLITLDHEGDSLRRQRDLSEWLAIRALEESCQAIASHVRIPQKMDIALVVFNSLNWKRSETITSDVYLVGDPSAFFTRPYHKLDLVGADGKSVPFEIIKTESTIIRSIKIRFRAENVPGLGWKTYYLRPSETHQALSFEKPAVITEPAKIQSNRYEVKYDPKPGSFTITETSTRKTTELRYHHQPVTVSKEPGFFKVHDAGDPVPVKWTRISQGKNLAGPYFDGEGEIEGAVLRIQIQLDGQNPVTVSEAARWAGGKTIKLVRQLEFSGNGRFVYGVPFGTQEFENLMDKAGPPKEGSTDEVSRDHWHKNREFDGWVAWRSDNHQVTIASESRGGAFHNQTLKMTLLASGGELIPTDGTGHSAPNEFQTRFLLDFATAAEAAPRLGWELYNPLEPMVSVGYLSGTLPPEVATVEHQPETILTTLKKAANDKGWIARAYAAEKGGAWPTLLLAREATLRPASLTEEEAPQGASADARLRPFEIRTVRVELARNK